MSDNRLLAIDPGPEQSAAVIYDTERCRPVWWAKLPNAEVLHGPQRDVGVVAIEMVASYGMAVGADVFETCVVVGRFVERCDEEPIRVYRRECKLHLCGSPRAKDSNIRQALIDRYGGKEKAIGRKANPGVLHGMSGDCWQALAVAVTAAETRLDGREAA